jgi:hypothetical protein
LTGLNLTTLSLTGVYTEDYYSIGTLTTSYTINLANGTVQECVLTNGDTCTFTMPSATAGQSFVMIVRQPSSTGSALVTFSGVLWSASGTPTMTTGANKTDIYTFFSDGTNWYGAYSQGYTY